jgi:8-oxo-dGTP pyrophosphatase MutT (NUDIX family)
VTATGIDDILALLTAHSPADDKEARDRLQILALCRQHPDIRSRECMPGHLTGSGLVVHATSGRVLLNHHRKLDRWLQFGGHFDGEQLPAAVALREGREESGLNDLRLAPLAPPAPVPFDVDVHTIPARGAQPEHLHLDIRYLLLTDSPEMAAPSAESHTIRWFDFAQTQALPLTSELRRMIEKARRMLSVTDAT